jgi:hypothetical protein
MNPVTVYDDLYPIRTKFGKLFTPNISFIKDVKTKGKYEIIGVIETLDTRDVNDYQALARREGRRIEGNSLYLRFIIKDDTDSIIMLVNYKNYEKMNGKSLSEAAVPGTFVYVRATLDSESWRTLNIQYIEIL